MTDMDKLRPLLEKQEGVRDVIKEQFIAALIDEIESGGDLVINLMAATVAGSTVFSEQTNLLAGMYDSANQLASNMKCTLENAARLNGDDCEFDF